MKTKGIQVIQKLNVLLAVLLCCILALHVPDTLQAAPMADTTQESLLKQISQAQADLIAGELALVEAKAILQLNKLTPGMFLHALWQRLHLAAEARAPGFHRSPAFKSDTGLHVIFRQGP